jgi:nickel-dependent lactate racemase
MNVELAYGKTGLIIDVPKERTTVIEPTFMPGLPDERGALKNAIRTPIGTRPLKQTVGSDQTVAISVCDITRPMPSSRVLPILLEELSHVPDEQITILIATGTHRQNTHIELKEMLGADIVDRYQVVNHNGFDHGSVTNVGNTSNGVPILLNRIWIDADFRITTGFVEPHFFAGFSGGPKMVAPGLAAFETIMGLHSAPLIAHTNSVWGITDGNPIHDSIREISYKTGVDFSIDVTINRDHGITSVYAGELFAVHKAACNVSRRLSMQAVNSPYDIVITTNSGYPLDMNVYQSVKGMSAAAQIVQDGGTIICASECSEGIPDHGEYKNLLASRNTPEELLDMINTTGYTSHDQWQVQIQAQIQLKAEIQLKSDFLTPDQITATHLTPIDDLNAAIVESLENHGGSARICVLPQGPQTIPYLT